MNALNKKRGGDSFRIASYRRPQGAAAPLRENFAFSGAAGPRNRPLVPCCDLSALLEMKYALIENNSQ